MLNRRELEGAPVLREHGEDLVLAERFLWPYALISAVLIVLGAVMSCAWLAILATGNRQANDWLLMVIGFTFLGLGPLMSARSELCFARGSRQLHRRTLLFGVPTHARRVRLGDTAESLILELSYDSFKGNSVPAWSLQIPRPTGADTLLTGHCPHAAAEEVIEIFADTAGLKVEIDRR